jgi:hypothetical protein
MGFGPGYLDKILCGLDSKFVELTIFVSGNFVAQLLHFIGCLILLVGYCRFYYEILLLILGFVFF